jgi:hypothetical protein
MIIGGSAVIACIAVILSKFKRLAGSAGSGLGDWIEQEDMPEELWTAEVFCNETPLHTLKPVPLHGITDQVLKTATGKLIPVDTKSRKRHVVHYSDIIQLSVYAVILRQIYDCVSSYGYIRTVIPASRSVQYHKVKLLSDDKIVELWHQYKRECSLLGEIDELRYE